VSISTISFLGENKEYPFLLNPTTFKKTAFSQSATYDSSFKKRKRGLFLALKSKISRGVINKKKCLFL